MAKQYQFAVTVWYILGQKGGIQQKDCKSRLLQVTYHKMNEEVNFKEFEIRCSLVNTGTGKELSSDDCNVDSC